MTRIQISGNRNDNILSITLRQILECIEQGITLKWKVLWFEGTGDINILELERRINHSVNGISCTLIELLDLSDKTYQLLEIVLIGSKDESKLLRYKQDKDMYEFCDYIIELVDSSY